MKHFASTFGIVITLCLSSSAQTMAHPERNEAEYYAKAYAEHYRVPLALVRSVVQQESGWRRCPVSSKGARGLMQLMPDTAKRLGVRDSCNMSQNVSGGVRLLAWLIQEFHGDLRLVAAAYYAGETIVLKRGLNYRNADVVQYVAHLRRLYVENSGHAVEMASLDATRGH